MFIDMFYYKKKVRLLMILWTSRLFVGDKIKKKKEKVIASINNREATFGVYCIAFASHPDNLFDILNANELLFPHYKKTEVRIVGIANGKEEAIDLVQNMLMEVYNKTGNFDVRSYFT
jgi:protoheme ferro-lyase